MYSPGTLEPHKNHVGSDISRKSLHSVPRTHEKTPGKLSLKMSEDQKFAWLLERYDSFSNGLGSSESPHSSSNSVYLTVEPSEARNVLSDYSSLFSLPTSSPVPPAKTSSTSTTVSMTPGSSRSSSTSRRSAQSLYKNYYEFSTSLAKTRRVLLRSVATEKELRMADVHLWRRDTRPHVPTTASPAFFTFTASSPTDDVLIPSQASPSSPIAIAVAPVLTTSSPFATSSSCSPPILTTNGEKATAKTAAVPPSSPSCSSDSESSCCASSSSDESSDDDETVLESQAQVVPSVPCCPWPTTSPITCAFETSPCAITAMELPPQKCCV